MLAINGAVLAPLRVASNHSPRASAGPAGNLLRRPLELASKPQLSRHRAYETQSL